MSARSEVARSNGDIRAATYTGNELPRIPGVPRKDSPDVSAAGGGGECFEFWVRVRGEFLVRICFVALLLFHMEKEFGWSE